MKRWTSLEERKYLNTSCQISASATGSSCDPVTYVTSVTNARSNTSPSEEVPPPYWDSQCLAKVLAGNLSKLADEIPSAGKTLLPHALPGAQPITPCHCPSVLSCPSAEGRNISISTSWCKTGYIRIPVTAVHREGIKNRWTLSLFLCSHVIIGLAFQSVHLHIWIIEINYLSFLGFCVICTVCSDQLHSLTKFSLNTIRIFTWPWVDRRPQSCITNLVFVLVLQFLLVVW